MHCVFSAFRAAWISFMSVIISCTKASFSLFDAHQTTTVCTQHVVTREAPCVADAFQAAALAAGVGRDNLTAWEFEETKVRVSASSMKP